MKPLNTISILIIATITCWGQTNALVSNSSAITNLPDGVFLDRQSFVDSAKFLTVEIVIPKTNVKELQSAQKLLISLIEKEKIKFVETITPDPRMRNAASGNGFTVFPQELYKDNKIISFLFENSYYHAGAAHPKSDFYTFNYDIQKQRQLNITDYFKLESDKDKDALVQLINSTFDNENIKVKKFYDFDFNIKNETVTFNFDDYEVASYAFGLQRLPFNKSQIARFINSEYQE